MTLPYGHVEAEVQGETVHVTDLRVPTEAQRDGAATRMLQELGEWAKAHGKHTITGDVTSTDALGPRAKAFGTENMRFYRYAEGTVDEKEYLPDMTYADAMAYLASVAAIPDDQRPEDFDETLGVETNLDEWEPGP